MKRFIGGMMVLGVGLVCLAQDRASVTRVQAVKSAEERGVTDAVKPSPFTIITMPYAGYGSITLLDEGTLIVRAGLGDDADRAVTGGFKPPALEVRALTLDLSGLSLIQLDRDFFLDKDGTELRRRGVSAIDAIFTPVAGVRDVATTPTPEAVDEFVGVMYLSLDASGRYLHISVSDFAHDFRTFKTVLELGSSDSKKSRVPKNDGATTWNPTAIPASFEDAHDGGVAATGCSATCTQGSCDITCPAGCRAYCDHGIPHCECMGYN